MKSNKFGFYRVDVEHVSMIASTRRFYAIFKLPKKNETRKSISLHIWWYKGKIVVTEKVVARRIIAYAYLKIANSM